ncbi:hypothetical protein L227DRAFT_244568 [Lentinus tigrinus ALCF2SS1-6]|uniref:Uncharacterized protein n=1 Tax=Lentinus tigrinus ALCF2SS1-6 TaxID=1328759 RepID=A0A5C2S0H0_9APHY|nr:hypothetical protein L227DRAFT_244568 [Lentinus tigrinus ALCF2SS1-6]
MHSRICGKEMEAIGRARATCPFPQRKWTSDCYVALRERDAPRRSLERGRTEESRTTENMDVRGARARLTSAMRRSSIIPYVRFTGWRISVHEFTRIINWSPRASRCRRKRNMPGTAGRLLRFLMRERLCWETGNLQHVVLICNPSPTPRGVDYGRQRK